MTTESARRSLAAYRAHLTRQNNAAKDARNAKVRAEAKSRGAATLARLTKFTRSHTRQLSA